MVDGSGEVELADLVPTEPPEVFVEDGVRVETIVAARVVVAAGIAEPDVVSSVGEDVCWERDNVIRNGEINSLVVKFVNIDS